MTQSYFIMAYACIFAITVSCGIDDRGLDSGANEEPLPVRIALGKVAASNIARVELVVSASDLSNAIVATLTIEGDEVVGTVVVPVGSNRVFTINAYDASGGLIYSGQSRADVKGNGGTVLPPISVRAVDQDGGDLPPSVVVKQAPNSEDLRFLLVPAGEFTMGDDSHSENNGPAFQAYLDHYYIGEFEITNDQFIAFLQKFGNPRRSYVETDYKGETWESQEISYIEPSWHQLINYQDGQFSLHPDFPERGDHPAHSMIWYAAKLFCEVIGARLPTEAEWEKAARGTDGRRYTWGDRFVSGWTNINDRNESTGLDEKNTSAVGAYPNDQSPYGAYDMVGNVREWTSDWFSYHYHYVVQRENPTGPNPPTNRGKTVRGSSYSNSNVSYATLFNRKSNGPDSQLDGTGFRCACDVEN